MRTPVLMAAQDAPEVSLDDLSGGGDVVVLAPHPDDETLGCGGAIAALAARGRRCQVIVVTDGARSHPASRAWPGERLARLRADEVRRAVTILTGGRGPAPILLGYPDGAAPDGDAAAEAAAVAILPLISPSTTALWSTWAGDPHHDHGRTARIAARICRHRPDLLPWSYPIWGRFTDAADGFDPKSLMQFATAPWQARKAGAVAAHASQMTGLISDDPGGFRMIDAHQHHFITAPELFLKGL
ncbi:PIG-L deacetylase family protein [Paracoccaceae bacterium Fryx2]|nr:PIG-L deacetylase family protein [Paracoccaceae bacterium Fryx2]